MVSNVRVIGKITRVLTNNDNHSHSPIASLSHGETCVKASQALLSQASSDILEGF